VISRDEQVITEFSGLQSESLIERLGGLLVMERLKADQVLWLSPCNSVHTIAMKYAIDLIYVDKNNQVCGLRNNVRPNRMSCCLKAKSTLELNSNILKNMDIKLGDLCLWSS
jgi:hypothetical protein